MVIAADDFGLAEDVNDAVEAAHRNGVLSAASLMVAGPAAAHAVALARRLPTLRVGLHLALVEATPASEPKDIPDLVDAHGQLRRDMVRLAFDIAMSGSACRQLRHEITTQFETFRRTGLALDHVNAHKHFHVHPLIAHEVLTVGRRHGMKALRVPHEPKAIVTMAERAIAGSQLPCKEPAAPKKVAEPVVGSVAATGSAHNKSSRGMMAPWTAFLRSRARRAGLTTPDAVFGLRWTGAFTAERLAALVPLLPDGLVEIYTHPAMHDGFPAHAPGYRYADELKALTDPRVIEAVKRSGRRLGGYADAEAAL